MEASDHASYIKKLEAEVTSLQDKVKELQTEKKKIAKEFEQKNKKREEQAQKAVENYKPNRIEFPKPNPKQKGGISPEMVHDAVYQLFKMK
jgi:uncharacterized coiled-coil DUF342 family protein